MPAILPAMPRLDRVTLALSLLLAPGCASSAAAPNAPSAVGSPPAPNGVVAPPTPEEQAGIEAAIQHYLHGIAEPDRERLALAFDEEQATMVRAVRNEAGVIEVENNKDMVAVLDRWAARTDPPKGALDSEILGVDVIDGRLALVSLRYWNTVYDALILARVEDRWVIVAKAYTDQ